MSYLKPIDQADRSLPCDREAERMILGVVLLENDVLAEAAAKLQPEDFYLPSHQTVWRAMLRLAARREGIDPVTLQSELGAEDMDRVGGPAAIAGLFDGCPRFSNIDAYITLVRRAAIRRELILASLRIADDAYTGEGLAEEVLAKANMRLADIDAHRSAQKLTTAGEVGWLRLQAIEDFQASGRAILGIGTGIYEFDRLTGGLMRGDQHLLVARPSMGKTALSVRMLDGVAFSRYNEQPVQVYFSMEMLGGQITDRWVFGKARVDQMRQRTNRLTKEDFRALQTATQAIDATKTIIDDCARRPSEVRAILRRIKREYGRVDVFYVDHIGKGETDTHYEQRRHEIGKLSKEFKEIAKEFNCANVIMSQLNRVSPGAGSKEPELHHLAESGNLEQDADMVFYPHRPHYYDQNADPAEAKIGILKQRNGPAGVSFPMRWDGRFSWFDNTGKAND